jgi:hypothetical protein
MSKDQFFLHKNVKGKDVYIVDSHHKTLQAWALIRRSIPDAPNLITIDHHTDTYEAFLGCANLELYEGRVQDQEAFRLKLVSQIDWRKDKSVFEAIAKLRHDEHINAATMSGIIDSAFCIQLSDTGYLPNIDELIQYSKANRIFVVPTECFVGCQARPHDDDCAARLADEIIETRHLEAHLDRANEIAACLKQPSVESTPYILDIDLDAFHSLKAINPKDPATFYRLIHHSLAITVATEAECVEELWRDEENSMNSEDLLQALLKHISQAC